jgi:hypothetical protein
MVGNLLFILCIKILQESDYMSSPGLTLPDKDEEGEIAQS